VRLESAYTPVEEPSEWWLKGLAVFMALLGVLYALSAFASGITPAIMEETVFSFEWEQIEPYPENGTQEEKDEWEEGRIAWQDMLEYNEEMVEVIQISALHSGLLAIIAFLSTILLWTGNRDIGIKSFGAWIGVNTLGGFWMMWKWSAIGFTPLDDYGPEAGGTLIPDIINTLSFTLGAVQIACCNLVLLSILALISVKSRPEVILKE